MTFSAPLWLGVAGLVLALGAVGLRLAEARRARDLDRFVSGPLRHALTASSSPRRRLAKGGLLLGGLALGCVALARPTLGWDWQQTHHRGTDVLFAVDVSRSMLADDVKPDRLTRAKLAVIDLLQKLGGDRVGLVAFAGSAFLQSPLTADHAAFQQSLEALDTDVIPRGGTDVGAALHEAEEAFRTAAQGPKLLVLLSDGEDLAGNAKVAAEEAAKQGVTVYTVGVGTPAGERISLARAGGRGVVLDEAGKPVVSKLDEAGLRDVAEATGGFYVPLGTHGEGLDAIYQRVLADAPKQDLATRTQRVPIERFQWPLGLALALVVGEALLGERRRARSSAPRVASSALEARPRAAAALVPALLALLVAANATASPRDAEKAYAAGDYEGALGHYRAAADAAPDDARLRMNEGIAAYRAGKHDEAAQAFSKALDTRDVSLQQRAYYDLGNARFRLGEAAAKQSPDQARSALEEAVKAYDGALALDPKDENARFNRDVAKARLEDLKRQQEQQKPESKPQQGSQDSQKNEQDSQQGQQDSQSPSKSGEGKQGPQNDAGQGQGEKPQSAQDSAGKPGEGKPQNPQQGGEPPKDASGGQPQQAGAAPQPDTKGAQAQADESKTQPHSNGGPGAQPQPNEIGTPPQPNGTGTPPQPNGTGTQPQRDAAGTQPQQDAQSGAGPRRDEAQAQGSGAAKRDGAPERADGKSAGAAPAASDARPGEMSAADAAQLLDSLRADEVEAPRAASKRGGAGSDDDEPTRNW